MRTLGLITAALFLVACSASETSIGYPWAVTTTTPAQNVSVKVLTPQNVTPGVPTEVDIVIEGQGVTIPRLNVATVTSNVGETPNESAYIVELPNGDKVNGVPVAAPLGIGDNWSWSAQPYQFTLPAVTLNGPTVVPVSVTITDPQTAALGALFTATASDTTSDTVRANVATVGVPTLVSTGVWNERGTQLPNTTNVDAAPASAGTSNRPRQEVPPPYAPSITRRTTLQPDVAEMVAGLTIPQVEALQNPTIGVLSGQVDTTACDVVETGLCRIAFTVQNPTGVPGTTDVTIGVNTVDGNWQEASRNMTATATVNGNPAVIRPVASNVKAWVISGDELTSTGTHTVTVDLTGATPSPADPLMLLINQTVGGVPSASPWGVNYSTGEVMSYAALPGLLSTQQLTAARNLPRTDNGTLTAR